MSYRHCTVRLEPDQHARIEAIAKREGRKAAEILRRAVTVFLSGNTNLSDSEYRHHQISEFSQIALDSILRKDYPELIDPVLVETRRRMETIHGKR